MSIYTTLSMLNFKFLTFFLLFFVDTCYKMSLKVHGHERTNLTHVLLKRNKTFNEKNIKMHCFLCWYNVIVQRFINSDYI